MNDSKPHTTPIQSLTNRIPTNFDNSNANLLSQDSQITLPKDQDQADYQNILAKWDSLSPRDSPSDLDFTIDNKSTRINPRKAIQRPPNQSNLTSIFLMFFRNWAERSCDNGNGARIGVTSDRNEGTKSEKKLAKSQGGV